MSASAWQAVMGALALAVLLFGAVIVTERRMSHIEDQLLTQPEVRDIYSRLAVIETRLDIDHAR